MKRIIIVIVITLIAAASANAQLYKGFGIKAGTSIANQDIDFNPGGFIFVSGIGHYQYKYGLTIGIFKEIHVIENLNAQFGVNYSQKGSIIEYDEYNYNYSEKTGNTYSIHNNLDFITAEVYAKYTSSNSLLNPYVLAGLRMDFFLSQHIFTRKGGENTDEQYSQEITNNKILGATIGAGIEFQAHKLFTVFLEGTYNPDFTYLTDKIIMNTDYKIRGHSFDIRTGIKF